MFVPLQIKYVVKIEEVSNLIYALAKLNINVFFFNKYCLQSVLLVGRSGSTVVTISLQQRSS